MTPSCAYSSCPVWQAAHVIPSCPEARSPSTTNPTGKPSGLASRLHVGNVSVALQLVASERLIDVEALAAP